MLCTVNLVAACVAATGYIVNTLRFIKSSNIVFKALRTLIGLVGLLYCFFIFWWICNMITWIVFASCVDPTGILPVGTMLFGSIAACRATYKSAADYMAMLQKQLAAAYDALLQAQIKEALETIAAERIADNKTPNKIPTDRKLTASDVFLALDVSKDSAGTLTVAEVKQMFGAFELNLTAREKEQFFAYCDVDFSGDLTVDEFQAGFDDIISDKLAEQLAGVGVSFEEAILAAAFVLASVVVLGVFIIQGITAYSGEGAFIALVQTAVIGLFSFASTKVTDKSGAPIDEVVDKLLKANSGD